MILFIFFFLINCLSLVEVPNFVNYLNRGYKFEFQLRFFQLCDSLTHWSIASFSSCFALMKPRFIRHRQWPSLSFLCVCACWAFSFVSYLFWGSSCVSPKFAPSLISRSLNLLFRLSLWEMEEMGYWVTDSLPSFAKNLHILLVDHDPLSLKHLASLLEQQSYNGTVHHSVSINLFHHPSSNLLINGLILMFVLLFVSGNML